MQGFLNSLWEIAAVGALGVMGVAVRFMLEYGKLVARQASAELQSQLADAATRAAGRVLSRLTPTSSAREINEWVDHEAGRMANQFAETLARNKVDRTVVAEMVVGELNKLSPFTGPRVR